MSRTWVLRFRATDKSSFEDIRSGRKSVETRGAGPKYQHIQAGDSLKIVCGQEQVIKPIRKIEHFDSVEALFAKIPLNKVMPGLATVDEATKVYNSYPGYQERLKKYGLLAFYLD